MLRKLKSRFWHKGTSSIYSTSKGGTPASLYQEWVGYPDSPYLTSLYPYQVIYKRADGLYTYWAYSSQPMYEGATRFQSAAVTYFSYFDGTNYSIPGDADAGPAGVSVVYEANNNIYTDSGLGTVLYAKTTS